MAKSKVKKEEGEEVAAEETVEAAAPVGAVGAAKPSKKSDVPHQDELVTIDLPVPVSVNGLQYHGRVKVPRHQADSMLEMVANKLRTDAKIGVGKNMIVHHLANGQRVEQEDKG